MSVMVEVKVSELSGKALDWAVGHALGAEVKGHAFCDAPGSYIQPNCTVFPVGGVFEKGAAYSSYMPSTEWGHGGPLIDKLRPNIVYHNGPDRTPMATMLNTHPAYESGETVLIAVCRAIVAAYLGDAVSVPAELIGGAQ